MILDRLADAMTPEGKAAFTRLVVTPWREAVDAHRTELDVLAQGDRDLRRAIEGMLETFFITGYNAGAAMEKATGPRT